MTCRDLIEFLLDYESGTLPLAERNIFDAHLAECPECVNYLRTYEQTVAMSKAAQERLPGNVPEELVAAILAARERGDGLRSVSAGLNQL